MNQSAFREEAVRTIAKHGDLDPAEVAKALTTPPKPDMGDLAFPCFLLAKKLKKAPPAIASELAEKVSGDLDLFESANAIGPYLNLNVDRTKFAQTVLGAAIAEGEAYGRSEEGAGKVVAIDYSAPNIAKPFHVGHLRSTIIGGALYRVFDAVGYKVIGINHIGDWGTQFGKQIVGLKRFGQPEDVNDLMALNRLYVKYHQEEEANPELTEEARDWFRRQEAGDEEALDRWRTSRETSLDYFKKIYERLGAQFDSYDGESFFNDKMETVVDEATSKGLTSISEGALIIDLEKEGIKTPALLKKADGATLYLTRDVAAARYRHDTFDCDRILYVVATDQSLHFKQLFTVLKLLGYDWAESCAHVNFGRVHGMSTRKGNVIYLEELLDEAKDRALKYMREHIEKRPDLEDEEAVAEAVGMAAIFFSDFSRQRIKDYTFDWDQAISFEGDTGPYLLNAHARIAGIIRKCGVEFDPEADVSPLVEPEAHQLVRLIERYPHALSETARQCEPSILASYLLDLAGGLHSGYRALRVKDEEPAKANARLLLFTIVKRVLKNGLGLLGIPALERM